VACCLDGASPYHPQDETQDDFQDDFQDGVHQDVEVVAAADPSSLILLYQLVPFQHPCHPAAAVVVAAAASTFVVADDGVASVPFGVACSLVLLPPYHHMSLNNYQ
jgi:hypothetical protein